MAALEETSQPKRVSLLSYQTALCIVPPVHLCQDINRLRALYDQAYGTWPSHMNIIYPFVPVDILPKAIDRIREKLRTLSRGSEINDIQIQLRNSGFFPHRRCNTVHLTPENGEGAADLKRLRKWILEALGQENLDAQEYIPHLTVGQTKTDDSLRDFLLAKANLLPPSSWTINNMLILIRERKTGLDGRVSSKMKAWGAMDFLGNLVLNDGESSVPDEVQMGDALSLRNLQLAINEARIICSSTVESRTTYEFSSDAGYWKPMVLNPVKPAESYVRPRNLVVSSYNVLTESARSATRHRYDVLLENILSENATADVFILQEVCDDFLSHLLAHQEVRVRYPFVTHGPPDQEGIPPLSSLRNIVVLSQWKFSWRWLPFEARHKGAAILEMHNIGNCNPSGFAPLVIAGIHLTSGLTDFAVDAKMSQLTALLKLLEQDYAENPRIIAGDFNITTSTVTMEDALREKTVSPNTVSTIARLEDLLSDARLSDAWVSRKRIGDDPLPPQGSLYADQLHEGEHGATFDPNWNALAAQSASENGRAQRYDRVLVHHGTRLRVVGFNMFGIPRATPKTSDNTLPSYGRPEPLQLGSDHWGVRAKVRLGQDFGQPQSSEATPESFSAQLRKSSESLRNTEDIRLCLERCSMLPDDVDVNKRKAAFNIMQDVLARDHTTSANTHDTQSHKSKVSMVVAPVGSYGLGTWNPHSDIDCLCVGSMSSRTFFALATQRLRKSSHLGIKILRKVKAASGTMLELEVGEVKIDLQYCPAAKIAERWSEVPNLPADDPLFDVSLHALTKLQPFRDLNYVARAVADIDTLCMAHRCITAWAKRCGVYSSKFGFLGGIHITMMLSRLYNILDSDFDHVTVPELVCTFFHHYAHFNWENQVEINPYRQSKYRRSTREPMVILTHHVPVINIARAVTTHSLRTIVEELKAVDTLLSEGGIDWSNIIEGAKDVSGVDTFLSGYNSYVKLNIQYWGSSLTKGASLLGWLESRCFRLLIDLNRSLPDVHARFWPARFTSSESPDTEEESEYQGCYLVGLTRHEASEPQENISKEDRKHAQQALQLVLEQFTAHLQDETKYYDPTISYVDATLVKQSEISELKLDTGEWSKHVLEDSPSDIDSEEEDDEKVAETDMNAFPDEQLKAKPTSSRSKSPLGVSAPVSTNKLRPAADILSRLRWDPSMDPSDYILGYEDRFLGTREMPIGRWKSEQTDEEFIPQHRILYFRRRSDAKVVWDRESRKDEIFGSGAGKE